MRSFLALTFSLALPLQPSFAQAPTVIQAGFVLNYDILSPIAKPNHNAAYRVTLTLLPNNKVQERWSRETAGGVQDYYGDNAALGGSWRVLGNNTIRGSWRHLNFTKYVTISVAGKSCSIRYDTALDSGATAYRVRGNVVISTQRLVDASCSIQ